jgi:flagellar FliJ protein
MTDLNSRTLAALLERETAARDAEVLALRDAQELHAQAQAQAQSLADYRAEYITRWSAQMRESAAMEIVHCYRSFMLRLDQALAQQEAAVQRAQGNVEKRRSELVAAETRVAAVSKLMQRRMAEIQRAQQRRDQRNTDEAAQRAGWAAAGRGLHGSTH